MALLLAGCTSGTNVGSLPPIAPDSTARYLLPPQDSSGVGFQIGTEEANSDAEAVPVTMYTIVFDGPDGQALRLEARKGASYFEPGGTLLSRSGNTAVDLDLPAGWPQNAVSTQAFGTVVVTCMGGTNVLGRPGTPAHLEEPSEPLGVLGFIDTNWSFSLSMPSDTPTTSLTSCQLTTADTIRLTSALDQMRIVDQQTWQAFLQDHSETNTMRSTTGG